MEDMKYGVKTNLVEEFKNFRLLHSLHRKMPAFVGECSIYINSDTIRSRVVASDRVISFTPFPLFPRGLEGFRLPPQRVENVNRMIVRISLDSAIKVCIFFDSEKEKQIFITMLNISEDDISSADESTNSSRSSISHPSIPSTDSGVSGGGI